MEDVFLGGPVMRVIHIFQRDNPEAGGALRVTEALAKEQLEQGLEVWVLFLYGSPSTVSSKFNTSRVICLGLDSSRQALRGMWMLRTAVRRFEPEIVHSHDGITWPRLALLRIGIPIVMHAHLAASNSRTIKGIVGRKLIEKTTTFLIGVSEHTLKTWRDNGFPSACSRHIPNGVDFERFRMIKDEERSALRESLDLPQKKRVLLWVGRLSLSMKGTDRLERVAERLPDDTVLLVVGGGPEFDGIQARCSSLLKSGRMMMTGVVSEPAPYYAAADAFLFTSYYEPFGLVILEAIASGLPILAFSLPEDEGASILLKEFGAIMIDDEFGEHDLAALLLRLDAGKNDAEINRAYAMNNYDWPIITCQVVDVYQSLLS